MRTALEQAELPSAGVGGPTKPLLGLGRSPGSTVFFFPSTPGNFVRSRPIRSGDFPLTFAYSK